MFAVCGEALWDLFGTDTATGLTFDARVGGSPLNVAVGLARLGQSSSLFTGVSKDALGGRLMTALKSEGVETGLLVRSNQPTTLSIVQVAESGHPEYAFYGANAADRTISETDLPSLNADVWGLHTGSYSLVAEPVGSALLALYYRERGQRLLSLDPNVRLNVEPDVEAWRSRVNAFACLSDLIKVSDEDLRLLYADRTTADVAAEWLGLGAAMVVVTYGEDGAEAFAKAQHVVMPSHALPVVDTVGAGDSFQAGLICGLAEQGVSSRHALQVITNDQIARLLAFATNAAAITCTRRGADLPHREELPTMNAPSRQAAHLT